MVPFLDLKASFTFQALCFVRLKSDVGISLLKIPNPTSKQATTHNAKCNQMYILDIEKKYMAEYVFVCVNT